MIVIGMFYQYQDNARHEFKSCETTFEAIKAGLRTSTCRKPEWYKNGPWVWDTLVAMKKGDRLQFSSKRYGSKDNEYLTVELTHDAYVFRNSLNDSQLERLSKVEGWSAAYLKQNGYGNPIGYLNLRYKLVADASLR